MESVFLVSCELNPVSAPEALWDEPWNLSIRDVSEEFCFSRRPDSTLEDPSSLSLTPLGSASGILSRVSRIIESQSFVLSEDDGATFLTRGRYLRKPNAEADRWQDYLYWIALLCATVAAVEKLVGLMPSNAVCDEGGKVFSVAVLSAVP